MNSSKSLTIALAFIAIVAIGTSAISTTYADINTRSAFIQTDKGVQLKVIGVPGEKGDNGAPGATGATGAPGVPGKDGTTIDNETLAKVNSLSANFAVFQQILQSYQNGSLQGKDGQNGRDGTNGTVTFICFDANNQTMVCPFTQIPKVVNETTPPVDNGTVIPPVTNETGTGGDNSTIPIEPPVDNTTTTENTTTTTNTTTTENGTTTETNSTSETVPAGFIDSLGHALGF